MSRRGILYITWGDKSDTVLERAMDSAARHHSELPVHVVRLPEKATLLEKAKMFDLTPFDETLYLDADTVVMGRLDFGFDKAVRHGLACAICECPWARRYGGLSGDLVEYNTGVLFFTARARPVFDAWRDLASAVDSSIPIFVGGRLAHMTLNDQAGFALAVERTGFLPFVLPMNWNFRPRWQKSFFGPVKIWHDYRAVFGELADWNRIQADERQVIQYNELLA
ncbi:MAG: hypothetical protein JEZ11_23390 [Desulfobacterales bacterium]|nr:hypothetical protein [Desulfobacterales bacterium]